MIERGTADRDAQFIAVGKVVGRFAPRWVFLWKEYFLLRTVQGTPLLYPALKRAQLAHAKLLRMPPVKLGQQRGCFQDAIAIGCQ